MKYTIKCCVSFGEEYININILQYYICVRTVFELMTY